MGPPSILHTISNRRRETLPKLYGTHVDCFTVNDYLIHFISILRWALGAILKYWEKHLNTIRKSRSPNYKKLQKDSLSEPHIQYGNTCNKTT